MLIVLGVEKKDSHNFLNIFVQKNVIKGSDLTKKYSHILALQIGYLYHVTMLKPKFFQNLVIPHTSRLYYSKELWNAKYNIERQTTFCHP